MARHKADCPHFPDSPECIHGTVSRRRLTPFLPGHLSPGRRQRTYGSSPPPTCAQIRMVPIKKGVANSITYLEKPEIDALLAAPDQSVSQGARDHALLLFLYNSGARASEAASLRIGDMDWHAR